MKLNRRTLIKLTLSVSLSNLLNPLKAFAEQNSIAQTLEAMIEIIIPTSDHKELANNIVKTHTTKTNTGKLISWGCHWLNQNSQALFGQHFISLTESQKIDLLKMAEQSKKTKYAPLFFTILRDNAMTAHYASIHGTRSLAFQTSPQPKGYLNHSLPPIERDDS